MHETDGDPPIPFGADDRSMVRAVDGEAARLEPAIRAHLDRHGIHEHRAFLTPIPIRPSGGGARHRLRILVDRIGAARGVHPPRAVIEPLIDEELSPGHRTIGVEPLLTRHLQLLAEEERGVRIDQEEGVPRRAVRGGDREAVRPARLLELIGLPARDRRRGGAVGVEPLEPRERDALDIAADASLGEGERHPGLEAGQDLRPRLRMDVQVVVEPIGPGIHEGAQPRRAPAIQGLQ